MIDSYVTKFCYRQKHNNQEVSSEQDWLFCMQKITGVKNMQNKQYINVFTAQAAKKLLQQGYKICDLKPDREDPDKKRTIFVFEYEDGIMDEIKKLKK
jgi:hypothetical protein